MRKPKIAFFDFACCEGCQLQVANLGEDLLDILSLIDVVEFREVISEKWDQTFDISIIEGSITTHHAEKKIKKIRERSKKIIAYGASAAIGGVNGMKNNYGLDDIREYVYKDEAKYFATIPTKPVDSVIKVDYYVYGCPIYPPEFIKVLKTALAGIPYYTPEHSVCVECKFNENICLYDKRITCMGTITRAGCNSWCINNGNICYGCRGLLDHPNEQGFTEVLKKYDISIDMIKNKSNMYNKCGENK